jgi:hypothetical protein
MKGLARRNTNVKYESPSTNQSKAMTKVKVFADGLTDCHLVITKGGMIRHKRDPNNLKNIAE